ncbi:MAG: sulfite exporter TauE/SafE family protein, partial [Bacteroidales bacterium]|nr:sulfite exporter TauE/SafE family protein [Bacteroidales bacterium]
MEIGVIIALIISGLIVGFINTLAGGGTIISMTLFLMLGLPPGVANGTNRIAVFLQNLVSVSTFKRKKILDIPKSIKYVIPVVLGSLIGSNIVLTINEVLFNYFFISVILLMVLVILIKPQLWLKENPVKINRPMHIIHWILYFIIG